MPKKYKIGVFGSGTNSVSAEEVQKLARLLGAVLSKHSREVTLITGACSGLPYIVAKEFAKAGGEVEGFSPVTTMEQQREMTPDDDLGIYTKIHFVSPSLPFAANKRVCMKFRNVLSTSECDAGIVISGKWGSLNEFTNLIDMQKTVAVMTDTGGIADELPVLSQKIVKEGQGEIIFESDPEQLITTLLSSLKGLR